MMRHDLLSDVLYVINNAEKIGKESCTVPASELIKNVLKIIQKAGFIGSFEFIDDGKSGKLQIDLIGRINMTRAIKPRFSVKKDKYEKWESRYLPAKGFGMLIVSTPKGVMDQKEAEKLGIGGKLLCYVY
jgi:small subunit ribosomal protein S8